MFAKVVDRGLKSIRSNPVERRNERALLLVPFQFSYRDFDRTAKSDAWPIDFPSSRIQLALLASANHSFLLRIYVTPFGVVSATTTRRNRGEWKAIQRRKTRRREKPTRRC